MSAATTITLHIGQAIPAGNDKHTANILTLWQELGSFFDDRIFRAQGSVGGKVADYQVSLAADQLIGLLETAQGSAGSFNNYLKSYFDNPEQPVAADLQISIKGPGGAPAEAEAYQVATVFLQQLVIMANITLPGSIQILGASYTGPGSHHYEAQNFDSRVFFGAYRAARDNGWPALTRPDLQQVWEWLETCETSSSEIAIKEINRVLFTLLKVAEQRHEYSARMVLLVIYQIELLLNYRHAKTPVHLRRRLRMILGDLPEAADCLSELVEVRNDLFHGNQPVRRPPLICHTTAEALKDQLCQHDSAVESGTVIVQALLQDLIAHNCQRYEFTETLTRE